MLQAVTFCRQQWAEYTAALGMLQVVDEEGYFAIYAGLSISGNFVGLAPEGRRGGVRQGGL